MKRYRLLHIHGCTDPELLPGLARSWRGLEKELIQFLKADRYEEEDSLFFVETDPRGRLLDISAFSGRFMNEMRKRAALHAPSA